MQYNNLINNYLNNILLFVIFFFPVAIILGSATINLSVALICVITLLWFFNDIKKYLTKNSLLIYLFFLFLYIFVNQIFKFNSLELLFKSLANFRYLIFSLGIFIVLENTPKKKILFYSKINLVLILFFGLDIIYQFFFYENILGFKPGMCTLPVLECTRFSGLFNQEFIAGSFISQIGLLMLFLSSEIKSNKKNLFILIFSLFIFYVILITGERTALLIFIITLFFTLFFKKKLFIFFIAIICLLSTIFILATKYEPINKRFFEVYSGIKIAPNGTFIEKIKENPWSYHYQASIELFLKKPITGYGIKSFRFKCLETNIDKKTIENNVYYKDFRACSTHPHNYFLEFLAEQGLIGGIFYIGLIIMIISIIYKKKKHKKETFLCIAIGSLILAIIFPFKPSGSFLSTYNASVLFYILGFFIHSLKYTK
jgi:O-antigen ligase